jgi:hypothetical protein
MSYKIELSENEVNQIMIYIQEKPYREVAHLVNKIGMQITDQQKQSNGKVAAGAALEKK